MWRRGIILFLSVATVYGGGIELYADGERIRDPFSSLVPTGTEDQTIEPRDDSVEKTVREPTSFDVKIQGIVWGSDLNQAVIDGKVYREGDFLAGSNAKVVKIDKGFVSFFVSGVLYEKKIINGAKNESLVTRD